MKHSIEFEDLFDWELESDRHYYSMLQAYHNEEEFEQNTKPVKIIVEHESNNESRKVRKYPKTGIRARLSLSIKALRAKGRLK